MKVPGRATLGWVNICKHPPAISDLRTYSGKTLHSSIETLTIYCYLRGRIRMNSIQLNYSELHVKLLSLYKA